MLTFCVLCRIFGRGNQFTNTKPELKYLTLQTYHGYENLFLGFRSSSVHLQVDEQKLVLPTDLVH